MKDRLPWWDRQLYKLAPLSVEIRTATALEDRTDAGLSQELSGLIEEISGERPSNPRGPVPVPQPAAGAGAPDPQPQGPQPGNTAPRQATPPPQQTEPKPDPKANPKANQEPPYDPTAYDPEFDDPTFGQAPAPPVQTTPPATKPLTVAEFGAEELRLIQFNLKQGRAALNRAQFDSWLAQRFTSGQKNEAMAAAQKLADEAKVAK